MELQRPAVPLMHQSLSSEPTLTLTESALNGTFGKFSTYGFSFSAPAISISDLIQHIEPGLAPRRLAAVSSTLRHIEIGGS